MKEAIPWRSGTEVWKSRSHTKVCPESINPQLNDRGMSEGEVDGLMDASLVRGPIARDARRSLHELQAAMSSCPKPLRQSIPVWRSNWDAWSAKQPEGRARRGDKGVRHWHAGDAVVARGHLLDLLYLDDGDALMHPALAVRYLLAFDLHAHCR